MPNDPLAEFIVRQASGLIEPDGKLELIGVTEGVARVRYTKSEDPACATCVLSDADIVTWLRESFASKAAHVKDIALDVERRH